MRKSRRAASQITFALVLAASIVAWLPLVIASQTPPSPLTTPVPDQRAELLIGADLASDSSASIQQMMRRPSYRSATPGWPLGADHDRPA